eukprot:COSAG01_NODE_33071_length_570_cov_1.736730_1_plen_87_part_10
MPPKHESKQPTIVAVHSEDKAGLDKMPPRDHPLSQVRTSRICICGSPGVGKSSLLKQMLVYTRSDEKPWAAVVVIHGCGEFTREWEK